MLRIYLDQNKWVDLARSATGNPLGELEHGGGGGVVDEDVGDVEAGRLNAASTA